jgi:hypothetical protein
MNFPLVTWSTTVGPIDVNGTPYSAQTRYGFGIVSTTLQTASADSVADYLRDAINTVIGAGTVTTTTYNYTAGPGPANSPLSITWEYSAGADFTVDFGSVAMANKFGFATQTVTFSYLQTSKTTTINPGAFWGPCGVAGDVRRMLTQRAAASSSDMSGQNTDVVNWGEVADLEMLATIFPAANYTRWFAGIQIYATAAGRQVTDPNNTMDGLLEAAAEGVTFRLYREAATAAGTSAGYYQECRMPLVATKGAADDYVTAADEPRLWSTAGLIFRGET